MRAVFLTDEFPEDMGYPATMLPKAMAQLGVDTHVITSTIVPFSTLPNFQQTYGKFLKSESTPNTTKQIDGYTVHYLPYKFRMGRMYMVGLYETLRELKPQAVQTYTTILWTAMAAALYQPVLGYKLFTENRATFSSHPLINQKFQNRWKEEARNFVGRTLWGYIISLFTSKCYAATQESFDLAIRYYGTPRHKLGFLPICVDTDVFFPIRDSQTRESRETQRAQFGYTKDELLCIYTGRFSKEKNPLVLAQAVAQLRSEGEPFRAIFFGDGVQLDEISACDGCTTRPFVSFRQLGHYYRMADIGIWPREESLSMLDAAACGIPIVVNHTVLAKERFEGNGLQYQKDNVADLANVLRRLKDDKLRQQLGQFGAEKMAAQFSWRWNAQQRLNDYEAAWAGKGSGIK